ncbi:oligosaccharide flippase family protein [Geomonas nitrogeniifigens]|uniref:Oligosaccharide flippase family protein n=1 Tax=Geomonas diazotrophica TaxID=2843197 RepID=A0ABX8JH03_9BACT|nr:oligosaccharide flippase family protein [Geomonas nitrogeniifigens]QWV95967.1 oligosaccharide flippase family protein [Geomonas nitrogeniifigens]
MDLRFNTLILFTANRYVCYALLFLRGVMIAKFLGPYLYGVWSFLTLVQQYLGYTGLGLNFAANVELSTGLAPDSAERREVISSSFTLTALVALAVCLVVFLLQVLRVPWLESYPGNEFLLPVTVIAGLTNVQQLLVNVYRCYGKLGKIVFSELSLAVLTVLILFFFKDKALISASIGAMIVAICLNLAVFLFRPPFPIGFSIRGAVSKRLLGIGIPLLVYNFSFILITLIGRTIVGMYYPIEAMGIYSFANVISGTAMLAVESVAWIIFPSILSRIHEGVDNESAAATLDRVRDFYATSVFATVFAIILCLPILFYFLPSYRPALETLNILLLSQALLSISFGYNCLAIARKKQIAISLISLATVALIGCLSAACAYLKFDLSFIAVSVFTGSLLFVFVQGCFGHYLLNRNWRVDIRRVFPVSSVASAILLLLGVLLHYQFTMYLIGVSVFILGNTKPLREMGRYFLARCSFIPSRVRFDET